MTMKIRFSPVRFSEGYEMEEVDDFLDRVERALLSGDGSVTAQDVAGARFTPVRFAEGYDMQEVDAALDDVLMPLITGSRSYDPEHDYSPRSASRTSQGPGFLARLLGRDR
jgi:DivIVA domain-containing protein